MIKKLLLFFSLFIIILNAYSQDEKILINGKILDSLGLVKNANIINLNTKLGTFSNDSGAFRMLVAKGDSLIISSVQHISKKILITDKILSEINLEISLKLNTYTLDEFELKKHNLMGKLAVDVKSLPKNKQDSILKDNMDFSNVNFAQKDFRIDANIRAKPIIAKTVTNQYSGLEVGKVLSKLNPFKKSKKTKPLEDNLSYLEAFPTKLLNELGNDYFYNQLKIPKEKYYHFLEYCKPLNIEKMYKNGKVLQVIEILRTQSFEYLKITSNVKKNR
ncbi:carboxypeptidase-like regulatory domain-containing protein [Polaribacter vadi]|uniref:carboxypeptidase-like regulatory domain-containing protein n=1 Tax=Polaribacter TaxID=52959 RepID=UPI001C08727E|nr:MULTISPECIES: carboxypeptidase-like regulatory domain-containing protein [Polaribacter]MBU3011800.1 carboxypeptidase-like regulatory domain-containing protein [Polaribacter vadi]MDO6741613.1 carboxypeptidase-like regulatory domain-containing protein [Polaribacter sp. 1_MG-2023]